MPFHIKLVPLWCIALMHLEIACSVFTFVSILVAAGPLEHFPLLKREPNYAFFVYISVSVYDKIRMGDKIKM